MDTTKKEKVKNEITIKTFNFSFLKGIESSAILSQIKLIDAKRLSRHVGNISEDDFSKLKQKLKELLP
ncbi:MAG: type II toxin-antitoxin system PemK/MazF family toxin [Candidatus Paceibacterota bacterium]